MQKALTDRSAPFWGCGQIFNLLVLSCIAQAMTERAGPDPETHTFFSTYWRVPMPIFSACSRVAFHSMLGLESLKLSW